MEKYLGVKLIEAESFYSTDKESEGYKVKYEDGYVSWSPKDVFEKAYIKPKEWRDKMRVDGENQEYQMRVIIEAEELQRKVDKLDSFLDDIPGEVLEQLVKDEHVRLKQQLMAMQYYLTILVERIERF